MSLFNSSELEQSVSEGISEVKANSDIEVSTDEMDRLRGELYHLKEKHFELENSLDDDTENNSTSKILERLDQLEERIEQLEAEPEQVIDFKDIEGHDAEFLKKRFDTLETELENKISQKQALEKEMQDIQERFQDKIEETNALEDRMEDMESQLEDVRELASTAAVEEKVDKSRFQNKIEEFERKFNEGHPALEQKMKDIQIEEKVDRSEMHDRIENFKDEIEEIVASKTNEIEKETPDKSEVGSLWASLEMMEDKIDAVESDKPGQEEFHSKLETMNDKVQSVENEFSGIEQNLKRINQRDIVDEENLDNKIESLRSQLDTEVSELKDKLTSKYATSKEVRALWGALEDLEENQGEMDETITSIRENEVKDISNIKDTVAYLELKTEEIKDIEEQISDLQESAADQEELDSQIREVEQVIDDRVAELSERVDSKAEKTQLDDITEELKQDIRDRVKAVPVEDKVTRSEMDNKLEELKEDIPAYNSATVEQEELESQIGMIKEIIDDKTGSLSAKMDSKAEKEQMDAINQELTSTANQLQKDIDDLREKVSDVEFEEIVDLAELEEKIFSLRKDLEKQIYSQKNNVNEDIEEAYDDIKTDIEEISKDLDVVVDRVDHRINSVNDEVTKIKTDIDGLNKEVVSPSRVSSLEDQIGTIKSNINELQNGTEGISEDLDIVVNHVDDELDAVKEDVDRIKTDIEGLDAKASFDDNSGLENVEQKIRFLEEAIDELASMIEAAEIEEKVDHTDLEQKLNVVKNDLRDDEIQDLASNFRELEKDVSDLSQLVKKLVKQK